MATRTMSHDEHRRAEWTAAQLRPIARWISVPDGTGRRRLHMAWSVPEPTPDAAGAGAEQSVMAQPTGRHR
jgi:hypothetical protein